MAGTMNKGTLDKGSLVKTFGGSGSSPTPPAPQGEYFVKVIDYDGTVLDEQWLDDGAEYTLPASPDRTDKGLEFQEWCSTETITNGKITINKKSVMIGALYTTVSGQNEFDIELNANTGLSVTFKMNGTKDWGDGTSDSQTSHTYSEYGKYTIKTSISSINSTSASSGFFGQTSSAVNQYCTAIRFATIKSLSSSNNYCFTSCRNLKYVSFPKDFTTISQYAFQYCSALSSIILPATTINQYAFFYCYTLKNAVLSKVTSLPQQCFQNCSFEYFVMPNSVTSIDGSSVFNVNSKLKKVYLSDNLTNIGGAMFSSCYSLVKIKYPKTISSISNNSPFSSDYNILEHDFSEHETIPPILSGTFNSISALCKIKVPSALYDQWITETGWSDYADYIVAV